MARAQAYRPGMLSSLILGGNSGSSEAHSRSKADEVGPSGSHEGARRTNGTAPAGDKVDASGDAAPGSAGKRQRKGNGKITKAEMRSGGGASETHGDNADRHEDVHEGAKKDASGQADEALDDGSATGAGTTANLESLFSPAKLKKFKRRKRVDEEADALEVARITEQARSRERRADEEEANAGKRKNKKAKKREAEEQERRRQLEEDKRSEIAQKRAALLLGAAAPEADPEAKSKAMEARPSLGDQKEEGSEKEVAGTNAKPDPDTDQDDSEGDDGSDDVSDEEDDEEKGGGFGASESDSEPESVIAGEGGDSSDDDEGYAADGARSGRKGEELEKTRLSTGTAITDDGEDVRSSSHGGAAEAEAESKATHQSREEQETEEEKESRTVFVGNLPTSFNVNKIKNLFKQYGAVESARLRSVAVEGVKVDKAGDQELVRKVCVNRRMLDEEAKDNVNAYVVFKDVASVDKALELNGMEVGGKHIRVDRAKGGEFDHTRTVFLGNVPMDAGEEEVRALFASKLEGSYEAVEGVRLVRDKMTFVGKGIGYVLLADRALAAAALSLQGTKLKGRTLRVMPCGKRTKGRGGKAKPGQEDSKFASFEGRRTTTPDGVMRRLKRKSDGAADEATEAAAARLAAKDGRKKQKVRPFTTPAQTGSGDSGGGSDASVKKKKPRWTNEQGERAGKAAGGRAPDKTPDTRARQSGRGGGAREGARGGGVSRSVSGGRGLGSRGPHGGGGAVGRGARGGRGGRGGGRGGRGGGRGGRGGGRGGRGGGRGRGGRGGPRGR